MYEKYPDYKYVWLLNKEPKERLNGVIYVKKNTLKWIKEILTSKVLIQNTGFYAFIPYRKNQVLIDTWHGGGAYKRVDNSYLKGSDAINQQKSLQYISSVLNYYISSSKKFTEVMNWSMNVDLGKFLPIGMPRNDVFFNKTLISDNRTKICQKYAINDSDFIVLYAPTYRGLTTATIHFDNNLDTSKIKQKLKEKYQKDVIILFRGHHNLENPSFSCFDKNVSDYYDMQELLCAADMLITDYSSTMWDYSLLYRPCFLFVPDFDEYLTEKGFYTDPNSWGFVICKTNEEIIKNIENFDDEKFVSAMKKHHEDFGSYENGTATETLVKLINDEINK
jgi:CDP-glycerol glycerophosphotransferase